jgi:hypothetical protein
MITDLDEAKFRLAALERAQSRLHVGEARDYLHTQRYRYSLLDLYQWTLPESFRQHPHHDRYRSYVEGEPLNQNHSLLEVGFLEKLGDLLPEVPWHDDWYTEGVVGGIAEEGLPLMDLGLNIYAEDILEQLEPAFLVLVALSEHGQFVLSQCQDDLEDLLKEGHLWPVMQRALASPTTTLPAQRHAVRRRFNREPVPVRFVPMAVNLIDKATGNYWLDAESDPERFPSGSSYHMPWNRESFAIAQQHGNRVEGYHQKVSDLNQWIEADPPTRLDHILTIWNACLT